MDEFVKKIGWLILASVLWIFAADFVVGTGMVTILGATGLFLTYAWGKTIWDKISTKKETLHDS